MILLKDLTKTKLDFIGDEVALSFLAEDGCFSKLEEKDAKKMFRLIIETCYKTGHLYTTSENKEGFIVYWTKKERPGFWPQFKMMLKMSYQVSLKAGMIIKDGSSNWTPTEKRYKKTSDFVEVFLICVRKEYQGQGYFRKMLEEAFDLADKRNTICVLDTDSSLKASKYQHVGMKLIETKPQKNGISMYALEYQKEL